jgi:hypothetical protein
VEDDAWEGTLLREMQDKRTRHASHINGLSAHVLARHGELAHACRTFSETRAIARFAACHPALSTL